MTNPKGEMADTSDFSLLHATARLPDGWRLAASAWTGLADKSEWIEYVLVVDEQDKDRLYLNGAEKDQGWFKHPINFGRPCTVDAWNTAAQASTGRVLIEVADDTLPCPHWDTLLRELIGDLSREAVVWPSYGWCDDLITHPILTRAYYERPGRGGCPNGELLYPDYISVGSDDDFTEYALRDGVVIDARKSLRFEHRHPAVGKAKPDAVYEWSNRQEAWDRKNEVLARRRREGFSR